MDPDSENYTKNKNNPNFLYNYIKKQDLAYHVDSVLVNEYIATQSDSDLDSEKNIRFIFDYIQYFSYTKLSVKSKAFKFMYNNRDLFAQYYKKDQVEVKLIFTIFEELNKNIEEKAQEMVSNLLGNNRFSTMIKVYCLGTNPANFWLYWF
jgi:hypothetical protein